ncbi:alpha/beta fold hydrolase [Salegentibacter sp. JZCK2]|uniref:alpha/beta hydrolase n=1 Tax=Salegentibacter tibetensis TaxID=2873600 RepID=UPI001CCBC44E|nr:alpha/beta fold hydrolase [Salegentibacter tibetensis]MBZ9730116.1 alpha/beta fold hydrolase [Salegentibacter tibetensis]
MKSQIHFLVTVFLLLGISSFAQEGNIEFPSFDQEITLSIGNDSIAVYALIASGKEVKTTVLLLHGIPGNEKNLDLAQELRMAGKNVIFFNYRGSWGSQGEYLYANCLKDVGHLLDYLSDTNISSKLRIDTSQFALIGHSLGGGLALIKGANDLRIKKVIALSPVNYGYNLMDFTNADSLPRFQEYLGSMFMLNLNPKTFIQEIINKKDYYNLLTHRELYKRKPFLIIDDFSRIEDDWPGKLNGYLEHHIIESDHSFTNKRKELIEYISNWL